jgi:hypothetical protein
LLGCGSDICGQPVLSPIGDGVAYSRVISDDSQPYFANDIRFYDIETGQDVLIIRGGNFHEDKCAWSNNGLLLACYDRSIMQIRIFNLVNWQETYVPTHIASSGVWHPASDELVFTDIEHVSVTDVRASLFTTSLSARAILPIGDLAIEPVDLGLPAFSPDNNWQVIAVGIESTTPAKQLWIIDKAFELFIPLTENTRFTHTAYAWHPSGRSIVFQRYDLSTGLSSPEVVLWQQGNCDLPYLCGEKTVIAENAFSPSWLP